MEDKNLIHVKFDFEEGLQAKKDVLSSELELLRTAKAIHRYNYYRAKELTIKLRLYKKIKELKLSMNKLEQILPKIKVPKILREGIPEEPEKEKSSNKKPSDESLEAQLKEIQNKLISLQENNQ